jgi:hypothetical protein
MQTKRFIAVALLFLAFGRTDAQTWLMNSGNMYLSSGNLGIGTSTPSFLITATAGYVANTPSPLVMIGYSGSASDRSFVFEQLGTSSAATNYFFLNGGLGSASTLAAPTITADAVPGFGFECNNSNLNIITAAGGTNVMPIRAMSFLGNGNVLIGKTTQTNSSYILDVNGPARVNELVVNATGADFVFERGYKLPSLSALEAYVGEHHHLPEIATAKQMQEEGVNLGENQTALLRKIEELTLYVIQQNKKLEKEQKRIDRLEKLLKQKAVK